MLIAKMSTSIFSATSLYEWDNSPHDCKNWKMIWDVLTAVFTEDMHQPRVDMHRLREKVEYEHNGILLDQ